MRQASLLLCAASMLVLTLSACTTEADYPETMRSDTTDDYFGTTVADPYRGLEELDSADTKAWVETQNAVAKPTLEGLKHREAIRTRLEALWNHERFGIPYKEGDRYFYSRNDGLQNQSVIYTTKSLGFDGEAAQEATIALDPNAFSEDGTVSLAGMSVSPNGRYIAYARSDGGSDWDSWSVRDLETGSDLSDLVEHTKFTGASWSQDSAGFFYSRYPTDESGNGNDQLAVKLYYHRLGTPQSDDQLIYEIPEHPRRNPYGSVTDDGRYLILRISEGYLSNAVYYADLGKAGTVSKDLGMGNVVKLLDEWDAVYNFIGNVGERFYFQTDLEAPRNRVIAIDVRSPDREKWQEVLPQSEASLQSSGLAGGSLVASYLEDVKTKVRLYTLDGQEKREVELPGIGTASGFGGKLDRNETFYSFTSFTQPSTIYRYDFESGESTLFKKPELDLNGDAFETTQVFYASKDATLIPMFITYRKGIELNGKNPTLLYGYGGFNVSLRPGFALPRAVWLEMGGVLAIPNLRGGGEYGREWHIAGTKLQKQNVFDDFIAAAEYLIAEGYTSTPKLAIQGGSNGGPSGGRLNDSAPRSFWCRAAGSRRARHVALPPALG